MLVGCMVGMSLVSVSTKQVLSLYNNQEDSKVGGWWFITGRLLTAWSV